MLTTTQGQRPRVQHPFGCLRLFLGQVALRCIIYLNREHLSPASRTGSAAILALKEEEMKAKIIAVIAGVVCVAAGVQAQNMIEYSHAASGAASSATAAAGAVGSALQKATSKLADTNGTTNSPKVWEAKSAAAGHMPAKPGSADDQASAKPTPPAVFILSNGQRLEATNYLLTADALKVQQGATQRSIPLSQLNMPATLAANHERGIDLHVPANNAQITISF